MSSNANVYRRTRLDDSSLFSGEAVRDPVLMALEYLEICKCLEGVVALKTMQAHVRYIIEFQWCVDLQVSNVFRLVTASDSARRPWYSKFRLGLNECQSIDDIEVLLCRKVSRWRGKASSFALGVSRSYESEENINEKSDMDDLHDTN